MVYLLQDSHKSINKVASRKEDYHLFARRIRSECLPEGEAQGGDLCT